MDTDKLQFLKEFGESYGYPDASKSIDDIRATEFKRLDGNVYLDHAGATLYSELQMEAIFKDLTTTVYGNPHSQSSSSLATSDIIEDARRQVLKLCNASPKEYKCIFTSGATAALKLVGEAFPWSDQSTFMYTIENHNSVLGIREYAFNKGAAALAIDFKKAAESSIKVIQHPIQKRTKTRDLDTQPTGEIYNLFAFPSECNFSGVRFNLDLIEMIKEASEKLLEGSQHCKGNWMVLLDAAKGCGTDPPNLSKYKADFVVMSFYKLFGYPTGLGALIVRNEASKLLNKSYFSGGTVAASIADIDFVKRRDGIEESFEDGTLSFLNIPATRHGFDILNTLTILSISRHTSSLARYTRNTLLALKHANGQDVCKIYGLQYLRAVHSGLDPVVSFNLKRADGSWVGPCEVEKLASLSGIQLRTGCFCNPGARAKCSNLLVKTILTKYSNLLIKTTHPSITKYSSFQEHLLDVSHLNPRITRKFWRKTELKPQDFLELLLGFESNVGKLGNNVKKVASLLGIFKWAKAGTNKGGSFKHLDQSFKIMLGLLVRVGLCKDAEWLLLAMDKEQILLDDQEICSSLIEWYVGVDELEKSIDMFDRMRGLNLVPSLSCYRTLVDYLIHRNQSKLLFRVYDDMLDMGMAETDVYVKVIQVLCRGGKVLDSRNLIKKTYVYGIKPNSLILDAIASGYCEKKDYDDMLSLFTETDCFPDVMVGNKIIHSICQNLGVEEAFEFLKELEHLGYTPDAITFGILIGWSCKEGRLRNALFCLSNVLSRGLKPHKYSYNAIISALFKHGMWNHTNDIVLEMEDEGVTLDISTFRVLLAGYCKNRQFDEVKVVIEKMVQKGLIDLSPLQDPVLKAFLLLGVDPLVVRVRRDNDVALSKTEFYDSVGNGLYLEGDVVDFDQTMVKVLDESMVPDYNLIILKDDGVTTIEELVHWGQELSIYGFSTLVKKFHKSNSGFKTLTTLLEKTPNLHNNLDEETLNLLVQAYVKRGFVHKSKKIFNEMVNKKVKPTRETYAALVKGLCKKGNSKDIRECCDLVQNKNWLPTLNDYKTLIHSLCRNNKVLESLFLFEHAMMDYPNEVTEIFNGFLENLCEIGFTKTGRALFQELLERGYRVDHVAYSHILSGLCKENRFSEAFIMSNKITIPNVDLYNVLLNGYCMLKDFRKVKELVGAIVKKNITIYISSYSKFVSLMCHEGRSGYAFSLKDLMATQSSSHITLYNILIFHLFASKNCVFVDTLLDEIQEKGLKFDDVTYNFLVCGFANCKDGSRSVSYLAEMISKDLKPSYRSIRAVIRFLIKEGELKKVLKFSQEMVTKNWVHCSIVQNEIVTGFLNMGKIQEAVNFLENMIRKDFIPYNINYNNLIKKMCLYGRKDTAFDLLDSMLIKGNIPDSTTYDCLVQDLCVSNKIDDALDLYTEMMNRKLEPSIKTYEVLTEKLCECGRTLEGEKLIDVMIRVGEKPSKGMFGSVVGRYRFEGNFTKASELIQRMQQFGYKPDFETHWSLISTLSRFSDRDKDDNSSSFLSKLLSESGFKPKKGVNPKS